MKYYFKNLIFVCYAKRYKNETYYNVPVCTSAECLRFL